MKQDLYFKQPLMNSAGMLGFAPDLRAPLDWQELGAFITNPVSLRRRMPAAQPQCIEYPGGFLLHSGLPNPGLEAVLKRYSGQWANTSLPIIVHLMADRPEETSRMVQMLESIENVMGLELGFSPLLSDDIILLAAEMCQGELPLIISLPGGQLLRLGPRLLERGSAALSLAAPRGALGSADGIIHGRLYGPGLFPHTLELVQQAARLRLPVIAAGGIWDLEQSKVMLQAGALAVQLDASFWLPKEKDPVK
jgi:dihydroorotate dehydrogenase